jgi:hypothetical protein
MLGGVTTVITYNRLHKNVSMLLHKVHMKSILQKFHWQHKSKDLHSKCIGTRMVGKQVYKLYNVRVIKSRRISLARHAYRVLVEKCEGKTLLERPRCISEDTIKKHLSEVGWEGVDWFHLVQDTTQ